MNLEEFEKTVTADEPPADLPVVLAALWWDFKGDWAKAHERAQQGESPDHAWVHAYLHRKEGDFGNARYWYGRAGKPDFEGSLENERKEITDVLLKR